MVEVLTGLKKQSKRREDENFGGALLLFNTYLTALNIQHGQMVGEGGRGRTASSFTDSARGEALSYWNITNMIGRAAHNVRSQ
jgi:hypothetical protein